MLVRNTDNSKYVNQNSGVRKEALGGLLWKIQYFGIVEEIWELDYGMDIMVALFRCRWIKQHQLNEIDWESWTSRI
jgi:hypothetical protein